MTTVFGYIATALVVNVIAAIAAAVLFRADRHRLKSILLRVGFSFCLTLLLLTSLHSAAVLWLCADETPFHRIVTAAVSVCITAGLFVPKGDPLRALRPRLCRFFRHVGVIAAAALVLETAAFHLNSAASVFSCSPLPMESASVVNEENIADNAILMTNGDTVTYDDISASGVSVVALRFEPRETPVSVVIAAKDDNFSAKYINLVNRTVRTDTGELFLPINTYGNLYGLKITVNNISGAPFILTETALCNAVPFVFSSLRFFILLIGGIGVAAIADGRLNRVTYNRRRLSHKAAIGAACLLCVSVSAALFVPYFLPQDPAKAETYENGDTVRDYGYPLTYVGSREAYTQQFDAFYKDQLYLDIPVDETLTSMDDPYDNSARANAETPVYYQWDRAYYDGHYYSYFGVTPLVVFFCPYFTLTGSVPRVAMACGFFAVLTAVFLCLLLLRMCKMFVKRANLLLLMLGLLASVAASGVWWQHAMASDYALPKIAGLCFLFATVWLGLLACHTNRLPWQLLCFALCGVAAVLTIGARPTMLFGLLLLCPAFVRFLLCRDHAISRKLLSVAAFGVPLSIGAAAIMWYNAARFGSPFDFGTSYQLTVSNVAANTLTLSLLPAAIYHYFLQLPSVDGNFPYLRPSFSLLNNYGRYLYVESSMGVLTFPLILTSMAGVPAVARRAVRRAPVKCAMYIMAPILAVVSAFITFCTGGVHIGYTNDVLAILVIIALPLFLELYGRLQRRLDHHHFPVFAALLAGTVVLGLACMLFYAAGSPILKVFAPQLMPTLESALIFWR